MTEKSPKVRDLEPWLSAGFIIIATLLVYGISIPWLGFYHDDWYMLWAGQSKDGLNAIIRLFQTDRPLIGWTFAFLYKFFAARVLLWQVFALVLKILTGLSVFWLLRLVLPRERLVTFIAALLFVLYPGFFQQPVAATFCIDLLGLNAIFISISLTIFSIKTPNRILKILAILVAVILGLVNLGLYEATIGLEVVRWALVWWTLKQKDQLEQENAASSTRVKGRSFHSFLKAAQNLAPYLLMLMGYLYWRLFIFVSIRKATSVSALLSDYSSNPLYSFVQIATGYIKDLLETILFAWFVPFYQFTASGRFNTFLEAAGIAGIVLALCGGYFAWCRHAGQNDVSENGLDSLLWLGLIAVIVPQAVINILGRNVIFSSQWDRYTTQSMLGVAILISAGIFKFLRGNFRWVVLGFLISFAVMTQIHSAAYYARFWEYERNVIWQLSWRAPGFQPDTTLIVSLPEGDRLAEEYEIWGPVNMAYYPGQPLQVTGQVPNPTLILDLNAKTLDKRTVRNINVRRDYGKALVLSIPFYGACLHVLDGNQLSLPFSEDGLIKEIASYSNINLINTAATPIQPQVSLFGAEPVHDWCYFYQKIGYFNQAGNPQEAARLADEARQAGLKPADESEWIVLVTAYINSGQFEKARAVVAEIDKDQRKYICLQSSQWNSSDSNLNPASLANTAQLHTVLCGSTN